MSQPQAAYVQEQRVMHDINEYVGKLHAGDAAEMRCARSLVRVTVPRKR